MEKWHIFGLLLAGLVVVAGAASAYMGFAGDAATRDRVQQALKDRDYQAWKDAVTAGLTQDVFNQAADRYNQHEERLTQMDTVASAVDANDYDAYVKALTDMGVATDNIPTQDDFTKLVDLHAEHPGMGVFGIHGMKDGFGMRSMHKFG